MTLTCETCYVPFEKPDRFAKRTKHHFCSHSCAAKYTNTHRTRVTIGETQCSQCGKPKYYLSKLCRGCKVAQDFKRVQDSPISKYISNGNARVKYSSVRIWAAKAMKHYQRRKCCALCDFDQYVEVCHAIPISKFPETALMGEVNGKKNLIYLCPNHHKLFDSGLVPKTRIELALSD